MINGNTGGAIRIRYTDAPAAAMENVRATLLKAPGPVRDVAEHLAAAMGKGIRTRLLTACALDEDGMVTADAVSAAASIELLHMATLVHDDIIDEAYIRRDIPTAQSKFGKEKAVLGGDWLLCAAINRAMEIELGTSDTRRTHSIARALVKSAERVCLGELDERAHIGDLNLTPRSYLRIIDRKTAALFCLSARAGAMTGNLPDNETALLVRFARNFGMAFQIYDDIKDYDMDEAGAQKTVRNDLFTGVVTIPAILSFARDPELKPFAAEVLKGAAPDAFAARVREARGIEGSLALKDSYVRKAEAVLKSPALACRKHALMEILGMLK